MAATSFFKGEMGAAVLGLGLERPDGSMMVALGGVVCLDIVAGWEVAIGYVAVLGGVQRSVDGAGPWDGMAVGMLEMLRVESRAAESLKMVSVREHPHEHDITLSRATREYRKPI
jgi:hypothetical protein